MNRKTYGEKLFESYLQEQGICFEHEPKLQSTQNLIDYVIKHPLCGQIFIEVKDIHNPLPEGAGAFDPYAPIRSHIEEGSRKFRDLPDALCVLVLVAAPGSFVELNRPEAMLGAMYGDIGFSIPFNPNSQQLEDSPVKREFFLGQGKMLRKGKVQNTRIAAIISLSSYSIYGKEVQRYLSKEDGRTLAERCSGVEDALAHVNTEPTPCVTVWENGVARQRLPQDIFRGEMDAWWTVVNGKQSLSFIGSKRKELAIDNE